MSVLAPRAVSASRERRTTETREPKTIDVVGSEASDRLRAELQRRGHLVREHADLTALLSALDGDMPAALVATFGSGSGTVPLPALRSLRQFCTGCTMALLAVGATDAQWEHARRLTPSCLDGQLPPTVLVQRIVRARVSPLQAAVPDTSPRFQSVVIRLWESVEIDGRAVYLGAAERNFLFLLAGRPGERIAKRARIDVGSGRSLSATACRRRLGQRLSPELVRILVPEERFEPYRFREPAEVEALDSSSGLAIRLRIIGRGEVSLVPAGLLGSVA